jgi:hypothetical protein
MAKKHVLKHTDTEIVLKCYEIENGGGTIDISLQNEMTRPTQVYVAPTTVPNETGNVNSYAEAFLYDGSAAYITGIWWGLKSGKQLDITRIINPTGPILHNHYYLLNAGFYEFNDFSDRVYGTYDIRLVFDGPGHCILRLRKDGWAPKIEYATFGAADDPNAVGS